jgi:hypothetical protein
MAIAVALTSEEAHEREWEEREDKKNSRARSSRRERPLIA